jgi:hypothetical protein
MLINTTCYPTPHISTVFNVLFSVLMLGLRREIHHIAGFLPSFQITAAIYVHVLNEYITCVLFVFISFPDLSC